MLKYISLILLLTFLVHPIVNSKLNAQSAGQPGAFTTMGFSPRGMALGNAATAVDQIGVYGYYNPALAAKPSETIQVDLSTALLSFDRQLHMVTAHIELPPTAGLSLGLINARVSNIDGRTTSGYHTDFLSTAEYQLFSNFGIRFSETVWGGIGIKYNYSDFHPDVQSASSIGLDLGMKFQVTKALSIGIAAKDLLAQSNIDTAELYNTDTRTNRSQPFPIRLLMGVSYDYSDKLLLSLDIENRLIQRDQLITNVQISNGFETTTVTRESTSYSSKFIRTGGSYSIHERLTLRGGLQYQIDESIDSKLLPSFGFSLHLPFDRFSPSIDYAIAREPGGISNMHVFSLRLNI